MKWLVEYKVRPSRGGRDRTKRGTYCAKVEASDKDNAQIMAIQELVRQKLEPTELVSCREVKS